MNLVLLLPAALVALAALALPLLLHLARRTERRPLDFAAWQWLSERVRPRRSLRFDDWPLLLVRLLLLALLALLLARPALRDGERATPWIVALPGVPASALDASDGAGAGAERHWLAPGFPAVDDDAPAPQPPQPAASLLRELDARLPAGAPLTVLVPRMFDGADAERPRLSRAVDWRIVEGVQAASERAATAPVPAIAIRHDRARAGAVRYLRAAAHAWRAPAAAPGSDPQARPPAASAVGIAEVGSDIPLPPHDTVLAWLADGALPAAVRQWVEDGGTALLDAAAIPPADAAFAPRWRAPDGSVVAEAATVGRGRLVRFSAPLQPARLPMLLEPDFADGLRTLLVPPAPAPTRADARAYAPATGAPRWRPLPGELAPWLLLAIALLFVVERWLAAGTRGRAAA